MAIIFRPKVYHLNEYETFLSFKTERKMIVADGNDCVSVRGIHASI